MHYCSGLISRLYLLHMQNSNAVVNSYIKVIKTDDYIMGSVIISGLIHLQHVKYKN